MDARAGRGRLGGRSARLVAARMAANGLAIGTILWREPVDAHLRGELARLDAVAEIGRRSRELIEICSAARTTSAGGSRLRGAAPP